MLNISEKSTAVPTDSGKWIGRIVAGVLLGEAIWNLIVSVMNNVFVPWLGDVIGQSSGLPTSFTQRPYNYPDFLVAVLEFCIAAIAAVTLNYLFQRQAASGAKPAKTAVPTKLVEPASLVLQSAAPATQIEAASPIIAAAPVAKPNPVVPATPATPVPPAPFVALEPAVKPEAIDLSGPAVANSPTEKRLPPGPKAKSPNTIKRKEVYYNSVGEPLPFDEDRS